MAFKFNPRIRLGGVSFGKRGVSIRTGIPGLTFRHNYTQSATPPASSDTNDSSKEYGYFGAVKNALVFGVLMVAATVGFALVFPFILVPLPFLIIYAYIYPLFATKFRYGIKRESVYVTDKRFKTGQRYEGYKTVPDPDVQIPLSEKQIAVNKFEGVLKSFIMAGLIAFSYVTIKKLDGPTTKVPISIKGIHIGSPIDSASIAEKQKIVSADPDSVLNANSIFAKEKGSICYYSDEEKVSKIVFTNTVDTSSFGRLSKLLVAKYGLPQDTTANAYAWHGKSDKLELIKSTNRVDVIINKD